MLLLVYLWCNSDHLQACIELCLVAFHYLVIVYKDKIKKKQSAFFFFLINSLELIEQC